MKRTFKFGKIDYYGKGVNCNLVTVEVRYDEKDGKKTFSASGDIWNCRESDILCGGQCLDTIAEYIQDPKFKTIHRLWKQHHLNDMHPECEHQRALGWREIATHKVKIYTFTLTVDAIRKQNKIKDRIICEAMGRGRGRPRKIGYLDKKILGLKYSITTHEDHLPPDLQGCYKLDKVEEKALGWLYEKDHPDGILAKPCPVCGHKYGTAWLHVPISEDDEKIIVDLLN